MRRHRVQSLSLVIGAAVAIGSLLTTYRSWGLNCPGSTGECGERQPNPCNDKLEGYCYPYYLANCGNGSSVDAKDALIPGVVAPDTLPTFQPDGSILPPKPRALGRSQP